jgi:hypothetical protein
MHPYSNRYSTTTYRIFTACLLLIISAALSAGELKPFDAHYRVFRNDQHIAYADFSLHQMNDTWVWSMKTEPKGIYSWLTSKRPYIETHMRKAIDGSQQLLIEVSGDYPDKRPRRASWFDHDNHIVYYADKNSQRQFEFSPPLYNYHSINLLYLEMKQKGETEVVIQFYKGSHLKLSKVTLQSDIEIPDGDSTIKVDKLSQDFADSKDTIQYYHQNNELAPLKIEQIKEDYVSVMWRDDK